MTFYEILGVSKNASQEEIRTAYKTLVKKYHPDLYQGDKSFAEKKTKEINEAYDTLSDENKKAVYDFEITPKTYTTSYEYTPPKYDYTPPKYDYYNNNYSTYYNRPNYTRSHTQTTQSQNTSNTDPVNQVYDGVAKKLKINLLTILMVLVIYLSIFIGTIMQFQTYKKSYQQKNPDVVKPQNIVKPQPKEFDINDYFTDSELMELYTKNYINVYDSFSDFKKDFSKYFETYYNFAY